MLMDPFYRFEENVVGTVLEFLGVESGVVDVAELDCVVDIGPVAVVVGGEEFSVLLKSSPRLSFSPISVDGVLIGSGIFHAVFSPWMNCQTVSIISSGNSLVYSVSQCVEPSTGSIPRDSLSVVRFRSSHALLNRD
jgi:hypothetical protein